MIETTVREREIYIYIRKLVPSLAEVLQPFTSKFTTGDVSNSLFLGARWRALAGKTQVTDIITRTNTLTYSQGHLNTMPFGINWDPTHPQQKSGWKISSFNHFWRAPERTSSWLTAGRGDPPTCKLLGRQPRVFQCQLCVPMMRVTLVVQWIPGETAHFPFHCHHRMPWR